MGGSRVAIVTGGAKGIGAAVCERLVRDGFAVTMFDIDASAARSAVGRIDGTAWLEVDVTSHDAVRDAVQAVLEKHDRIDALVNNAGWDRVEHFLDNDPALWQRLIEINLLGPVNVSHLVLPHMLAKGSGRVVNVASDAGRVGSSGETVYSACKGGVIAFTKSIAREMARHGITANCVCPGPTDTPLLDELRSEQLGDRIMDAIVRATPLQRLAMPEDIAEAVAFFLAPGAGFITGQVLSVSGGLSMVG